MKLSPAEIARQKQQERERIKQIVNSAPDELKREAVHLALNTSLSAEEVARRLLAKASALHAPENGHTEQSGSIWSRVLKEAAAKRVNKGV